MHWVLYLNLVVVWLSNFVHREIILCLNLAKWMTNHLQKGRGYVHVTHFCMHNCGLQKISTTRHAVNSNAVDSGPMFLARCTVDASAATLRLKLHRFDLSLYLLQTWLYNISTTNRPSGF